MPLPSRFRRHSRTRAPSPAAGSAPADRHEIGALRRALADQERFSQELTRVVVRQAETIERLQDEARQLSVPAAPETGRDALAAQLADQLAAQSARLDAARAECQAMRDSTSWQITAPLRALADLLRRLRTR